MADPIQFDEVHAQICAIDQVLVNWTLKPTAENLGDVEFIVQRSGGLAGPYKTISGALNAQMFLDVRPKRKHFFRNMFYRVIARRTADLETLGASTPVMRRGVSDADMLSLEVVRQLRIRLRRTPASGVRLCAIFSIKDFGTRCSECYDEIQERVCNSQCRHCMSTGWVHGYFNQVNGYVDFDPPQEMVQVTEFGEWQESDRRAWLDNFPPMKPRDLIVDETDQRWRVVSVQRILGRGDFLVQQIIQVRQVKRTDVEYKLRVEKLELPDDVFMGHSRIGGSVLC